jgi:tetratricopeptide (TPR) repeat protein
MEALSRFSEGRALFDQYLENGDWTLLEEARDCFDRAVAEDQEFDTARFYRAVGLIELGKLDDAKADLDKLAKILSLTRSPELQHDVHMQLAQIRAENDQYEEAKDELKTAGKTATKSQLRLIDASLLLLDIMQKMQKADKKGLKGIVDNPEAAWKKSSGTNQALLALRSGSKIVEAAAHTFLYILGSKSEWEEAKAAWEEGFGRNETLLAARFEMRIAEATAHTFLYMLGSETDWEKAKDAFDAARQLRPNSRRAIYNMAQLHIRRGDRDPDKRQDEYKNATLLVARLTELYPSDPVLHRTEALLRSRTGEQSKVSLDTMRTEAAEWAKNRQEGGVEQALQDMAQEKDLHSSLLRDLVKRPPISEPSPNTT